MAQRMQAGTQFYENLRLQHAVVHASAGLHNANSNFDDLLVTGGQGVLPDKTYQGDGHSPPRGY
jgi:hypothetical protein